MADLNGMQVLPKKGLSTVANPGNGLWSIIIDTENADAPTLILGGPVSFTTVVLGPSGGAELVITPTTLAANADDYSPTSWSAANRVRLSASAPVNITGFDATATVGAKSILNTAADVITLKHEDAASSAVNRIHIPGGVDLPLAQDDSVSLWYDAILTRWRLV